jgi:hypothetical protein
MTASFHNLFNSLFATIKSFDPIIVSATDRDDQIVYKLVWISREASFTKIYWNVRESLAATRYSNIAQSLLNIWKNNNTMSTKCQYHEDPSSLKCIINVKKIDAKK